MQETYMEVMRGIRQCCQLLPHRKEWTFFYQRKEWTLYKLKLVIQAYGKFIEHAQNLDYQMMKEIEFVFIIPY